MNEDHLSYLKELRDSGKINMYGSAPDLALQFGLELSDAREIVKEFKQWCEKHN